MNNQVDLMGDNYLAKECEQSSRMGDNYLAKECEQSSRFNGRQLFGIMHVNNQVEWETTIWQIECDTIKSIIDNY